ncbi:MAG: MAPEG family protein [Alphaproteobacteria bacterium]|nr:MAPEG family protein [Alphaproteobacteria bacterium]
MTLFAPATLLTAIATVLAILTALWTAIRVARTRRKVGIQPPAMTGSPELECAVRVQANTVEQIVLFLPALWLAALYFQGWIPGIVGLVWCVGRIIYAATYKPANPGQRFAGFALTVFPTLILVILAVIGIVKAWMVASA